jgi:hypothetical protein
VFLLRQQYEIPIVESISDLKKKVLTTHIFWHKGGRNGEPRPEENAHSHDVLAGVAITKVSKDGGENHVGTDKRRLN